MYQFTCHWLELAEQSGNMFIDVYMDIVWTYYTR